MSTLVTTSSSVIQIIILLGPPGAGKGTHATLLSSNLKLPHISTGDLFRIHLKNKTPLGIKAQKYINIGELVPDDLVLEILKERISNPDCKNGYILDGFPRTYSQAKALDQIIDKNSQLKVAYLNAPDTILVDRITGRLSCSSCNSIYHKIFSPPKKELYCDSCDSLLSQRKDDTKDVIQKRLKVYHSQTKPLIEYYKTKGNLAKIDVYKDRSKDDIFEEIKAIIKQKHSMSLK